MDEPLTALGGWRSPTVGGPLPGFPRTSRTISWASLVSIAMRRSTVMDEPLRTTRTALDAVDGRGRGS
jgi:hypothetical protein